MENACDVIFYILWSIFVDAILIAFGSWVVVTVIVIVNFLCSASCKGRYILASESWRKLGMRFSVMSSWHLHGWNFSASWRNSAFWKTTKYGNPYFNILHPTPTQKKNCSFSDYKLFSGMLIFRFFRYFWPDLFSIFFYFIFLFLNFLSLFVFIFCETARTRRFSVIFTKVQWRPWLIAN